MRYLKGFLLLVFFTLIGIVYSKKTQSMDSSCHECGVSSEPTKKIINGKSVQQGNKYPWLVSLTKKGTIMCGGAIISSTFILTAAHCFLKAKATRIPMCQAERVPLDCYNPFDMYEVGILSPGGSRDSYTVSEIIVHSAFSISAKVHDLALMKLAKPIRCGPTSLPICLPVQDLNKYNQNLIVAGWGQSSEETNEKLMLEGLMTQVGEEECVNKNDSNSKAAGYLCAVSKLTKQKSCFGDSGSAIFSQFGERYFATGVTSFGISSKNQICALDKPVIFTRIYRYMKWIRNYVQDIPHVKSP